MMSNPAAAGPTTFDVWNMACWSDSADCSCEGGTSIGTEAERVGESMPDMPAMPAVSA